MVVILVVVLVMVAGIDCCYVGGFSGCCGCCEVEGVGIVEEVWGLLWWW